MAGLDYDETTAPAMIMFTACPDSTPVVKFSDIPPKVSIFDQFFYQEALAPIGLMPMISMIIALQGFFYLGGIRLDWCRSFKL